MCNISEQLNIKISANYKYSNIHIDFGDNIHGTTFYDVQRFFQSNENIDRLVEYFKVEFRKKKLEQITLVGTRDYLNLMFSRICHDQSSYNYKILYFDNPDEIHKIIDKDIKSNIVLIVPIACTFESIIRQYKYLAPKEGSFIFVYTVFATLSQDKLVPVLFAENKLSSKYISSSYTKVNHIETENSLILELNSGEQLKIHVVSTLSNELWTNDNCPLCSVDSNSNIKNYTTKAILEIAPEKDTPLSLKTIPEFRKNSSIGIDRFFNSDEAIVFQNYKLGVERINSYINPNKFYENNKDQYLNLIDKIFKENIEENSVFGFSTTDNLYFISPVYDNESNALYDIVNLISNYFNSITVIRWNPIYESIDEHIIRINEDPKSNKRLFYYDDILATGQNFIEINSLVNSLSESKNDLRFEGIFCLINRTNYNTETFISSLLNANQRKLFLNRIEYKINVNQSKRSNYILNNFKFPKTYKSIFSLVELNVPKLLPIRLKRLRNKYKETSKLIFDLAILYDTKSELKRSYKEYMSVQYLDNYKVKERNLFLQYLVQLNKISDNSIISLVSSDKIGAHNIGLYNLLIKHSINSKLKPFREIRNNYYKCNYQLIDTLINDVFDELNHVIISLFVDLNNKELESVSKIESQSNLRNLIYQLIVESVLNILCEYPYIYFYSVKLSLFDYVSRKSILKLSEISTNAKIKKFEDFRILVQYVDLSLKLGSNFILSDLFINVLKNQFNLDNWDSVINRLQKQKSQFVNQSRNNNNNAVHNNFHDKLTLSSVTFKLQHISNYINFLVLSYKKITILSRHNSYTLEKIIQKLILGYNVFQNPSLLSDPFYIFIFKIHLENTIILSDIQISFDQLKNVNQANSFKFKDSEGGGHDSNKGVYEYLVLLERDESHKFNSDFLYILLEKLINFNNFWLSNLYDSLNLTADILLKLMHKKVSNSLKQFSDINLNIAFYISYQSYNDGERHDEFILYDIQRTDYIFSVINSKIILDFINGIKRHNFRNNIEELILIYKENSEYKISVDNYFNSQHENVIIKTVDIEEMVGCFWQNNNLPMMNGDILILSRLPSVIDFDEKYIERKTGSNGLFSLSLSFDANRNLSWYSLLEILRVLSRFSFNLSVLFRRMFFDGNLLSKILYQRDREKERTLSHGINNYLKNQSSVIDNLPKYDNNTQVLETLNRILHSQFNFLSRNYTSKSNTVTFDKLVEYMLFLFNSKHIGKCAIIQINSNNFYCDGVPKNGDIQIQSAIIDIVLPELIINIKKHCPLSKINNIKIILSNSNLSFINDRFNSEKPTGLGRGLKLCKEIVESSTNKPFNHIQKIDKFEVSFNIN